MWYTTLVLSGILGSFLCLEDYWLLSNFSLVMKWHLNRELGEKMMAVQFSLTNQSLGSECRCLTLLWTGSNFRYFGQPKKYSKIDIFSLWKFFFQRVSQKKSKLKNKLNFFWLSENTKKQFLRLFCAVHFFYLGLYFQNISIFWL